MSNKPTYTIPEDGFYRWLDDGPTFFKKGKVILLDYPKKAKEGRECPRCKNKTVFAKMSGVACFTEGCKYWFCY